MVDESKQTEEAEASRSDLTETQSQASQRNFQKENDHNSNICQVETIDLRKSLGNGLY